MALTNLSPRQRMINLMYLIFIAMLALNMSKQVLSAFGSMNVKLVASNVAATKRNTNFLSSLAQKASEQPEKYGPLKSKADKISALAKTFDAYLEELKTTLLSAAGDPRNYEEMDRSDALDDRFFNGDKLSAAGKAFIQQMVTFREEVSKDLANDKRMERIVKDVNETFNTDPIKQGLGSEGWLQHNYKGFPLIASLTKITQIQSDIKTTESEILSNMLHETLYREVSMTNYTTLLEQKKSVYFNGELFDGEIVLGRTDATTVPNKVVLALDGKSLNYNKDFFVEGGKIKLHINSGQPGIHKIEGQLIFDENGKPIDVYVDQSFTTVPKPDKATVSADKMNVVYRGVKNPMTISFAGISDNSVTASAKGLSKIRGNQYVMDATGIRSREVAIGVSGKIGDQKVSDRAVFRIKDLPRPTGTIRGQEGVVKMSKSALKIATVGAKFDDFDFNLPLRVTGFKFKVPGQPTIDVKGNKLDKRAQSALLRAKRGGSVQIFDIRAKATNVSIILKKVSPVIIEITN